MDYESSTNNAHDEEYPINIESNFPFSPNSKDYEGSIEEGIDDHREDNIPQNDDKNAYTNDDPIMEMFPGNIVSRSRTRPFCINSRCSIYTRGRA